MKTLIFRKKGQTFYLLMLSFLSIMFLCCLLISTQFIFGEKKSLDNTEAIYRQVADKAMSSLSQNLTDFQKYREVLVENVREQLLLLGTMSADEIARTDLSEFHNSFLMTFISQNQIPGSIPYIYFEKGNYALGIHTTDNVLETGEVPELLGITMEDWEELISAGEEPLAFIQQTEQMDFPRLMLSQELIPGVCLIFAVPAETISNQMDSQYMPENSILAMVTSNDQYILSDQTVTIDIESEIRQQEKSGNRYINIEGTRYFLYCQTINSTDITLAVLIRDDLYPRFYRNVAVSIGLALLLWIIGGGLLSWTVASRLYRPVAVLLKNLPREDTYDTGHTNELEQVQAFLDILQTRSKTYAEQLESQKQLLANSLFLRLLNHTLDWTPEIAARLEESGFPSDSRRYLLFQVNVIPSPDFDNGTLSSSVFDNFSFHATLSSHLEEEGYRACCISCSDYFIVFVDLKEKELPDFEKLHRLHPADYPLAFLIAVSGIHTSMAELSAAYSELTCTMDELMMKAQTGKTAFYSSRPQSEGGNNSNRFLSSLRILSGSLQAGNYDGALEEADHLQRVLSEEASEPENRSSMQSYLRSTLRITLSGLNNLDFAALDALQQAYPLRHTASPSEFFYELKQFIAGLPSCLPQDTRQSALIQEIKEYLQSHYTDSSLSAGQIADCFQVNISWLSVHFKEETGIGFLDYLHGCRLAKARELLANTKKPIKDIALETGYTNSATFSRAFNRYEGVTPSWYRKNHV